MNFEAFLRKNANIVKEKEVYISDRFRDENGKLVPFKIKPLKKEVIEQIKNQMALDADKDKKITLKASTGLDYEDLMLTESIVFPDLTNKELQDSYGVIGEANLINEMLLLGEKARLTEEIAELNGFDDSKLRESIEQAKN